MPSSIADLADGLETRLATITGLRVFDHIPDVFAVPCAFVLPESVDYHGAFANGLVEVPFTVTVVVGRSAERASQKSLYAYMSATGDKSVRQAIEADQTLAGVAQSLVVENAENIRVVSQGEADYLAVDFSCVVYT